MAASDIEIQHKLRCLRRNPHPGRTGRGFASVSFSDRTDRTDRPLGSSRIGPDSHASANSHSTSWLTVPFFARSANPDPPPRFATSSRFARPIPPRNRIPPPRC